MRNGNEMRAMITRETAGPRTGKSWALTTVARSAVLLGLMAGCATSLIGCGGSGSGTDVGQTANAFLSFSPASRDFGNVAMGASSAPRTFTVTNTGAKAASNVYVALADGTQFAVAASDCGTLAAKTTIAGGAACTFEATFSPESAGAKSDTVTVTYAAGSATAQTRTAALSGNGLTSGASLSFSPSSHDFGNVTLGRASPAQTFVVTNLGGPTASNVYLALAAGTEFSIGGSTCGTSSAKVSVSGGGTCSFTVTFTPASAGAQSSTLTLTYDGVPSPGQTVTAGLSGFGLSGTTTHGLTIPSGHPRLWFDAARLATARTWATRNSIPTPDNEWSGDGYINEALNGLLNDDAASCRVAINWGLSASSSMRMNGVACDECRWFGEQIILTYDFCYDYFTDADQRATYVANTNAWIEHWSAESWGGVPMHQNNYYWGYVRNELEWAITTYGDNTAVAEALLDDVFITRLRDDFNPATSTDSAGGFGQEGTQYGQYLISYPVVPFVTAGLLGRDVLSETNFWKEAVYAVIYNATPGRTTEGGGTGYGVFPSNDADGWGSNEAASSGFTNFMTAAAMRWASVNVGKHARQYLNTVDANDDRSIYLQSVDPGGEALPFTSLPLDYYAAGPRYAWGRNVWGPDSTVFHLELGDRIAQEIVGHSHADWGTWQLWRNGRWVSREATGYATDIKGYGGSGSVAIDSPLAHNSVLVNGAGTKDAPWSDGSAVVRRLESRPGYFFAVADLTPTNDNSDIVHVERDFVFVRGLETLVIFDRLESTAAGARKTFLAHCEEKPTAAGRVGTCTVGTQSLVMTTLVPSANPVYHVVNEGGEGIYRLEVETAPGTSQSYILTVLQAKDTGAASLSPTVTDNGASYTVTLDGSNSITFEKGMVSSGGKIKTASGTTNFRSNVQSMTVSDDGPVWH